jgi:F-type H+-transporting ATPase subunit epsilon
MSLEVHVVTPEREVWGGEADLLIARGVDGEVGIMGGHAPLLVQLAIGALHVRREAGNVDAVVDGGFLHVSSHEGVTRADVLASHAELADEIDLLAARRRLEDAENRAAENNNGYAKGEIAKAMARIDLVS